MSKSTSKYNFLLRSTALVLFFLTPTIACADQNRNFANHPLYHIEISGISLATPTTSIADILKAQGYDQVRSTMFTKQEQLQNQRKTIFRIEVEDTAAYREITYHRSLSGGRVKSSIEEEPVPEFEIDTASQLYQIICKNITEEEKTERSCEPFKQSSMIANHGQFIQLDDHFSVQLSATAANTAIGIKLTYE